MSDLISRQAAIDAALTYLVEYCGAAFDEDMQRMLKKRLDSLPSAQQWISCEKRLPEDYTDVLVWFEYYRYGDYNRLYQMHGIGTYISGYDAWMINHETGWRKLRVFAWMPLPKPWKGEQND